MHMRGIRIFEWHNKKKKTMARCREKVAIEIVVRLRNCFILDSVYVYVCVFRVYERERVYI